MFNLIDLIIDLQNKHIDYELKIYCKDDKEPNEIIKKINISKLYGISCKITDKRIVNINNYISYNNSYLEYKLNVGLLSSEIMI